MNRLPYTWVDVFTPEQFGGNQLCVFDPGEAIPLEVMQKIARELNHSETTFLQPANHPDADVQVRILLPTLPLAMEIPFAGHPLLGSACVAVQGSNHPQTVVLETGAGLIRVQVVPQAEGSWYAVMEQPLPRLVRSIDQREGLMAALGLTPNDLLAEYPVEAVDNGMQTVIVPLVSVSAVQRAVPDMTRLRDLLGRDGLCTLVFAPGGLQPNSDLHCRVFSPFDLVTEDPATGSANGPLGEYAVRHGLVPGASVRSEQGYQIGRPSELVIEVERKGGITTAVRVGGQVQLLGQGEFRLRSALIT